MLRLRRLNRRRADQERRTGMYQLIDDIPVWGEHEESTLAQIRRCAADEQVARAALMADGHLGYAMPIGGVVAYRDAISPNGVGFDISCGLKAAKTDLHAADVKPRLGALMDEVARTIVLGIGRSRGEHDAPPPVAAPTGDDIP